MIWPVLLLAALQAPANAANAKLEKLRVQAKAIVNSRHCSNCHSPEGSRPVEGAMKIYDLSKAHWFAKMSNRQLRDFQRRIFTDLTPEELKESGGPESEKPLSRENRKIISDWIDAEIANRSRSPFKFN